MLFRSYTYTVGWAAMNRAYVEIMDETTKLNEMVALQARVLKLEQQQASLLDLDNPDTQLSLGGLGGGMMLAGTLTLAGWRRRERKDR